MFGTGFPKQLKAGFSGFAYFVEMVKEAKAKHLE
ncbi:hypothetical protein J2Y67_005485 [Neobacillus niacini]|nr:hypothetical protein [Neobacillus niacini]